MYYFYGYFLSEILELGQHLSLLIEFIAFNLDVALYFQKVCPIFVGTLLWQSSKYKIKMFLVNSFLL